MSFNEKRGNYIRSINAAATLLAYDAETINQEPKQIAKALAALAHAIYEEQNAVYEEEGWFDQEDSAPAPKRNVRSGSSKPTFKSKKSGPTKSQGSGNYNLRVSPAQEGFFSDLIAKVEELGGDPLYSFDELNNADTYDDRQAMVDELIEQRDSLK